MINEIDENEDSGGCSTIIQQKPAASTSALSEKQASREYMKTFSVPRRPLLPKVPIQKNLINTSQKVSGEIGKSPQETNESVVQQQQDSVFDDDFDMTQVEEFEIKETIETGSAVTEEELLNGWETMQQGVENVTETTVVINTGELPLVENEDGVKVIN